MKLDICPICESDNIEIVRFKGENLIFCLDCKYDEKDILLVYESEKSQSYSPVYKSGGPRRTYKT